MSVDLQLVCPCGVPAPPDIPGPGRPPAHCLSCATPLVRPGGVPRDDAERALGAALLVASVLAIGWMVAAVRTDGAAHWALPVAGAVIGLVSRAGAKARGPGVQRAAAFSFVAFVALGEVLLYRGALLARLTSLHAAEGAPNAELLAHQEIESTGVTEYLHLELTFWLFAGFAAGLYLALRLTRAPVAVEAFRAPPQPPALRAPEVSAPSSLPSASPGAGPAVIVATVDETPDEEAG